MKTEPQLRETILKAAAQVLAQKGYVAASLEAIAEIANTDIDSIKRMYGSKANLGAAWLNSLHAGSVKRHDLMLRAERAPEHKIRDYFEELKPWLLRNKFLGCQFTAAGDQDSLICPQVAESVEEHKDYIRNFMTKLATAYLGMEEAGKRLGTALFLLYTGATTEAATLRTVEPVDAALAVLDTLLPQWKSAQPQAEGLPS